jgi:hypothetical protein
MTETLPTHLPPRDRRHGKRVLTLRNLKFFGLAIVLAFVALMITSEILHRRHTDGYGRLFGKQVSGSGATPRYQAPEPVTEGTIADEEHADALLVQPAARSQYLGADPVKMRAAAAAAAAQKQAATLPPSKPKPASEDTFGVKPEDAPLRKGQHVAIVGGADGVTVVKKP